MNAAVAAIFKNPPAAIWISLGILIWCALIVARNASRQALVDRFVDINSAMIAGGGHSQELQLAWKAFRETILKAARRRLSSGMPMSSHRPQQRSNKARYLRRPA